MRIELVKGANRPWLPRLVLYFVSKYVGLTPGPMLFMTYDFAQVPRDMLHYVLRSSAKRGAFSKGERELFAAFVSNLNSCHF